MAAQLVHTGLKGDSGAGGVLFKDHGQSLALEIVVGQSMLLIVFHLIAGVQDVGNVLPGQVQQLEQILFHLKNLQHSNQRAARV